ncbi:GGDEF domain-containing protein [Luteimonas deserti]|uniref:diguanylate cyclase n=1 Tax=Luteimonas deserti TaxID=2752306 RepID=A0A7Z0QNG5_9GAMM|nr:GGDEF domain-containing protein [Luteimonas deserti]NYZ61872.1 diguanylate cyclase [Luteimonas deserti]
MRWGVVGALLLAMALCVEALAATAPLVRVSRSSALTEADAITAVRGSRAWQPAGTTIRRGPDTRWWRIDIDAGPAPDTGLWIVAIREAYDAQLVAYAPPDYRPRPLATFDPAMRQIGSRQRLTVPVPAAALDQPVFVEVLRSRAQPMGVEAQPVQAFLAADYARVRFSSAVLSAQLLLAIVAAIFAVALRRWMLLLFCVWVLSAAAYLVVMSGEVVPLAPWLPPEQAMRVAGLGISLGLLSAYGFFFVLLRVRTHFPRIARVYRIMLLGCAALLVILPFIPVNVVVPHVVNVLLLLLGALTLGMGLARALAGDREALYFLVGWGLVSAVAMMRAVYFLREAGTPEWLGYLHPAADALAALILVMATARAARYAEREMVSARHSAMTDPLTGLPNRAQLDAGVAGRLQAADGTEAPLAVLFVDLDHFKQVNDRFGHDVGDACLQAMAGILRRHVRASDLVARYGGEEFVLVLDGASAASALRAADALRAAVEADGRAVGARTVGLTVSIGVATRRAGDDVATLFKRADDALYRAKREGRNRVVLDAEDPVRPHPEPA